MDCRAAVDSDVPLLARINAQLIEDEWGSPMSHERLERRIRGWLEDGDYRAILFEEGGDVVAYTLFSLDDDSAYIRHFFVMRAHRGKGVGRRAIELLMRDVVPPHVRVTLDVLASNRAGVAFWRSVGFSDYSIRMERDPDKIAAAGDAARGAELAR